jgi:hypothetical protein
VNHVHFEEQLLHFRMQNPLDHDFRRMNQWQAGERVPIEQPAMRQPQHLIDSEEVAQMGFVDGAVQVSTLNIY